MKIYLYYDADNFSYKRFKKTIKEIKTLYPESQINTKSYGDFSVCLEKWNLLVNDYSLQLIHYPMISKKTLTDTFLIADALEDLYTKDFDILALASDDIDFYPLIKKNFEKNKRIILLSQNGYPISNFLKDYVNHYIHIEETEKEDLYENDYCANIILQAFKAVKNNNEESDLGVMNVWLKQNIENFDILKTGNNKIKKWVEKDGRFIIYNIADKCLVKLK